MQDIEHPGPGQEAANMLQRRAHKRDPGPVPPELQKVLPITWFHVPKAGTSFVNTIAHLPGVCPTLPEDRWLDAKHFPNYGGLYWPIQFTEEFGHGDCPGLADTAMGHDSLLMKNYTEQKGRFMTMMRSPEQRMISAYKDLLWAVADEPLENVLADWRSWGGLPNTTIPTLEEWMDYGSGCVTRMLTRDKQPCGGKGGLPTKMEVKLAKERLQNDFSFIGITDDWPLSMCVFSAMFNVPCFTSMFVDDRQVRIDNTVPYDESELNGKKDIYDDVLFAEVVRMFHGNMKKHNVTEESCWDACWRPAGLEGVLNRTKTTERTTPEELLDTLQYVHYDV
uniref:Sulfotransferase domain-containing protein n=1 Tax=Alexandrium catenella TaxID=2925 RepID=A0A7S1MTK7_ALECA